ncbi:hypothetical protein [Ruminiclostridium cellobioparum]|uniref:Butirosin biosynthesis protein H N-terminal domain-containing protein n=1 Tax=Ruminiclostridium cellobioparum subsp. termitidis CT1112 TaxID=1195236 RepID=S0FL72_RUMCE|nr:hypothetical protein [Ruminiclostridium cellobioparum]EMS69248.1 hypothetical protein CTER_5164 [Ruminiclostridium cellobioparum subsp. termitidis CT1112]
MNVKLDFKPFELFWMNCQFNMLFSMLTSVDNSYKSAALLNDYSYIVNEMETPNSTKYNELTVRPAINKYINMLLTERNPLNFENKEQCLKLLKELIKKKEIILLGVDLFYWIPNSVCWNKHHWEHYSFINGFDEEKRAFYVFDENFNGYNEFEIPEDRLIKAVMNFPLEPHAFICKLSKNIEKFEPSISEIKNNAGRIVNEINEIIPIAFWELCEKDFIEGHMCDLISTQIFQIINRHIANQILMQELESEICDGLISKSLVKYCIELQEGWNLVKNKLLKIYYSNDKKSLRNDINKKCKSLLLKEIDMWNMFLKYTD